MKIRIDNNAWSANRRAMRHRANRRAVRTAKLAWRATAYGDVHDTMSAVRHAFRMARTAKRI